MFRDRKRFTTEMLNLDIRKINKAYLLSEPGWTFTWNWYYSDDKRLGSIGISVMEQHLRLRYQYTAAEEQEQVYQDVGLNWTDCNYGSWRPWFICPGCGRRAAILYACKYFYCRICHDLAYPSENEEQFDRLFRKVWTIRDQLKAPRDMTRPILYKPKGMHWNTFMRLTQEAHRLEAQILSEMGRRFDFLNRAKEDEKG